VRNLLDGGDQVFDRVVGVDSVVVDGVERGRLRGGSENSRLPGRHQGGRQVISRRSLVVEGYGVEISQPGRFGTVSPAGFSRVQVWGRFFGTSGQGPCRRRVGADSLP
jgi:hypothetical protein